MKRMTKLACAACTAMVVASSAFAEAESEAQVAPKSKGYTAVAFGFATPVQLPWGFDWDVYGLDLNLGYSDANRMRGLQVALGANAARTDLMGAQVAIGGNYSPADSYGLKVALLNLTNGELDGVAVDAVGLSRGFAGIQVDLLGAGVDGSFYGFTADGLGSLVSEDMWGVQAALGANFARRVHGLQAALIFNMTESLTGAQVSLVNFASECPVGFQIGLVNIILDNVVPVLPIVNGYF